MMDKTPYVDRFEVGGRDMYKIRNGGNPTRK